MPYALESRIDPHISEQFKILGSLSWIRYKSNHDLYKYSNIQRVVDRGSNISIGYYEAYNGEKWNQRRDFV